MTRKTTKTGKTPKQRRAEREELLATVADKIDTLASSAAWVAYLRFLGSFRSYSFNNTLLISVQCPHAVHGDHCEGDEHRRDQDRHAATVLTPHDQMRVAALGNDSSVPIGRRWPPRERRFWRGHRAFQPRMSG